MSALERDLGPLDILVNNAAINRRQPIEQFSLAEWRAFVRHVRTQPDL